MVGETLEDLGSERDRSVHRVIIPAKPARYGTTADRLSEEAVRRLENIGVRRLYAHQAKAFDLVASGKNIVVTTGTASGKSLCYNLPVLEKLISTPKARALYIFPTKALAQDQLRALRALEVDCATFDGDTPSESRAAVRREAAVILTNPDMLHRSILPEHKKWATFFLNLSLVVIDEAHALRGAFGSNVAQIIRRLVRIAEHYGSDPHFVLTSATLSNPGAHASNLVGAEVEVVSGDGAPRGRKFFMLWNPPLVDEAQGKRASSNWEAATIVSSLVKRSLRTICFTKTRKGAELVLKHTRDLLDDTPDLSERIASYRAGYLPKERREIERAFFSGELMGVSATNALELGIDVGALDAAVINGFPGTITSLWQQAGRAGRREGDSIAVLVASEDPLDQYYVRHPEYFYGRSFDEAVVDLENPYINRRHIACAAYELPLTGRDETLFGPACAGTVDELVKEGRLKRTETKVFYAGAETPSAGGSIRGSSGSEFIIVTKGGELLETTEEARAVAEAYPGAVYLHKGESYLVEALDLQTKTAVVDKADLPYYTQLKADTDLRICDQTQSNRSAGLNAGFGKVRVEKAIEGYQKRLIASGEIVGFEELNLPPSELTTQAVWFTTPSGEDLGLIPYAFAGGLHALEHVAIALLPTHAMCDRWDVGGVSTPLHRELEAPAVFIYDSYEGGIGISLGAFTALRGLLEACLDHLSTCPCRAGCPSCVQSPKCGNLNEPLDKAAAIVILKSLL
ncbi:MAG: DEAD/DEAH box helicase [Candidatus Aquicultorales bacterium]